MVIAASPLRLGLGLLIVIPLIACTGGVNQSATTATAPRYSVGGSVSGLSGSGLVLQDNSGESLTLAGNGPFTFQTSLTTGSAYYVVTAQQPSGPNQTCDVSNSTGTISAANVGNIDVVCTDKADPASDSIGVTTTGVTGTGLVLQNNGGDNLAVSTDGSFTFALTVATGSQYDVSVLSPPISPYQDCVVSNGSGTTNGSDVANIVVACTVNSNPTHTISGTITGVSGSIVLQDNGRDDVTVTADGPFQFPLKIPQGSVYNVSTKSVAGGQSQTCQFQNARGIVGDQDVTNVVLSCDANIALKVAVSGLSGTGLTLQNNGNDNLAISANGTASFPTELMAGEAYSVAVVVQPSTPSQTCTVTNGAGTAAAGATASVTCVTNQFAVGGSVTGLPDPNPGANVNLVLQNNLGDDLTIPVQSASPTAFTFPTSIASGATYSVTVKAQPGVDISNNTPGVTQTTTVCLVTAGTGIVGNGPVTDVAINCIQPSGFAYVTNGTDNTVTQYIIDGNNGLLLPSGAPIATDTGPTCAMTNSSSSLYVCNTASNDLSVYSIDPNTGVLVQATGSPVSAGLTAPTSLALYAYTGGLALYATGTPAGAGAASALTLASTPATLTPINQLPTGSGPTAGVAYAPLSVSSTTPGYYAELNSTANSLSVFQLDGTTGALTAFQNGVVTGQAPRSMAYYHGFNAASALSYDALYVANTGDGTISTYIVNTTTALLAQQGAAVTAGAGLNGLVVQTGFLYATAAQGVFGFSFAPDGSLTPLLNNPAPAGVGPGAVGGLNNFIYVVNQTDATVSVFSSSSSGNTGALTPIAPNTPIKTGRGPTSILIIPRPNFSGG
jgi:6-phosphogluconolactonase (cycloisomerase 2 family)